MSLDAAALTQVFVLPLQLLVDQALLLQLLFQLFYLLLHDYQGGKSGLNHQTWWQARLPRHNR